MRLSFRKFDEAKRVASDPANAAFSIIENLISGVWLVRLLHTKGHLVDHCIMVDGKRRVIIDSAEIFSIRLCSESLNLCSRDDTLNLRVAEVKELIIR